MLSFFSSLNYGIEIYLNTTRSYTKILLSTQNRLLKILQFIPFWSNINKLYTDFEVLKAHDLHEFNIYCLMHKLYYRPNVVTGTIKNIFIQHENIHQYNTRHKRDFHAVPINQQTFGRHFSCIVQLDQCVCHRIS